MARFILLIAGQTNLTFTQALRMAKAWVRDREYYTPKQAVCEAVFLIQRGLM